MLIYDFICIFAVKSMFNKQKNSGNMKSLKSICVALCAALVLAGCNWNNTQKGAAIGGGGGAALGAIVGALAGNTAIGAVIGGAVGAGAGALIGKKMGVAVGARQCAEEQQRL